MNHELGLNDRKVHVNVEKHLVCFTKPHRTLTKHDTVRLIHALYISYKYYRFIPTFDTKQKSSLPDPNLSPFLTHFHFQKDTTPTPFLSIFF